jgi:hypothetical protein
MIVHHKWRDLECTRCGSKRRKYEGHWEWKFETESFWSPTPRDCKGDLVSPFRVLHKVPVPQVPKHEADWYFVLYRGTEKNCARFLRDHAKDLGIEPEDLAQNYKIEGSLR